MNFKDLIVSMIKCEQTAGQSVYQHGLSVYNYFEDLMYSLDNDLLNDWKIPEFLQIYKNEILSNLYSKEIINRYTLFHDCGKPYCRIIDDEGKVHFPNHAEVSKQKFLEADGEPIVANLIGWDMCIHTESSIEIQKRLENDWTIKDACVLLLISLCELHSNARLFNGTESTSFKIKFKQIEKRGKQICKFYFGDKK